METILDKYRNAPVVVFAVWEPMLPTDWSAPGAGALNRLNDSRVRQFWDPNHMVAGLLKKAEEDGHLQKHCCERKGTLWDLASAYAPRTMWTQGLPKPVLFDGPVVNTTDGLDTVIAKLSQTP